MLITMIQALAVDLLVLNAPQPSELQPLAQPATQDSFYSAAPALPAHLLALLALVLRLTAHLALVLHLTYTAALTLTAVLDQLLPVARLISEMHLLSLILCALNAMLLLYLLISTYQPKVFAQQQTLQLFTHQLTPLSTLI